MDSAVVAVIEQMATTTIGFVGSVVSNLWTLLLSLAVLGGVVAVIMRKARVAG